MTKCTVDNRHLKFVRNTSFVCYSVCDSSISSNTFSEVLKKEFYFKDVLIDECQNYHNAHKVHRNVIL